MLFRSLFTTLILIANLNVYAQDNLKNAKREISLFNYSRAVDILKKHLSKNDKESECEATFLLADCYRMLNDVGNSKIWFGKAISVIGQCPNPKNPDPEIYFHYAQSLRSSGEYQKARKLFQYYDSLVQGRQRGKVYAAYCDSAIAWMSNRPEYEIRNAETLNSAQSEFGCTFYHKGIIFASDRLSSGDSRKTYGWTGNNYLDLYFSEPVKPDHIFGDFNKPLHNKDLPHEVWHDGPVTFNGDFTTMFLNQTKLNESNRTSDHGKMRTHLLKIFSCNLINGKWSALKPFSLNSDSYSVGHPALTKDGKTLYFVSDMPGGYGETDIWCCHFERNSWTGPVNLGPAINTTGKEMFPFIAADGALYFASDGLPGFGGLDLYVSYNTENQWSKPHNLGRPVNSSYDELSLIITEDNSSGLFTSNRPGGLGSDDLYCFRKSVVSDREPIDSIISKPPAELAEEKNRPGTPHPDTLIINKSYRLENIFYDFDQWNIRADAELSLMKLVIILREYPVSVELGSHTDCRGTEEYNMELSQKRAESAVHYIISCGISASRITARGYGKSRLLNKCNCEAGIECSEEEHQLNRRTEFKILTKDEN